MLSIPSVYCSMSYSDTHGILFYYTFIIEFIHLKIIIVLYNFCFTFQYNTKYKGTGFEEIVVKRGYSQYSMFSRVVQKRFNLSYVRRGFFLYYG